MPQQSLSTPNPLNGCHGGEGASTVTVGCSPTPMKVRWMDVIPGVDDGATDRLDADPVDAAPEQPGSFASVRVRLHPRSSCYVMPCRAAGTDLAQLPPGYVDTSRVPSSFH